MAKLASYAAKTKSNYGSWRHLVRGLNTQAADDDNSHTGGLNMAWSTTWEKLTG